MNKLHDWLIAATTIARISTDVQALGEEITWLRREAYARGQCLEIAMEALRWYNSDALIYRVANEALVKIEARLEELEPGAEEETG